MLYTKYICILFLTLNIITACEKIETIEEPDLSTRAADGHPAACRIRQGQDCRGTENENILIMKPTNAYLEAIKNIPLEIQKETSFSFAVADKIHQLLVDKGMTQKQLAKSMGKTEEEVSVWLSGQHNFTLRTLAKISVVLGENLICFPQ